MLSMDLLAISETEQKIIRHWLGFYQAHRETFNYGKWDVTYHQSGTAYAMVSNERESIIILHDSARIGEALAKAAKHVFLPTSFRLQGQKLRIMRVKHPLTASSLSADSVKKNKLSRCGNAGKPGFRAMHNQHTGLRQGQIPKSHGAAESNCISETPQAKSSSR